MRGALAVETMERPARIMSAVAIVAMLGAQSFAQGTPQTAGVMKVDPASVATGYRVSKVVGSTVVTPNEVVPFAVLSVGGFLGMGAKYVVVPYSALKVQDKKMVLPGATKDSLKALPEFKYAP